MSAQPVRDFGGSVRCMQRLFGGGYRCFTGGAESRCRRIHGPYFLILLTVMLLKSNSSVKDILERYRYGQMLWGLLPNGRTGRGAHRPQLMLLSCRGCYGCRGHCADYVKEYPGACRLLNVRGNQRRWRTARHDPRQLRASLALRRFCWRWSEGWHRPGRLLFGSAGILYGAQR